MMKKLILGLIAFSLLISCSNTKIKIDKETEIKRLNEFMNAWHHAAAVADEDIFFGSLDSNAVYLGTDPGERWTKKEFMTWGMKYFQRDTAWAFTPYNRNWAFSDDMNYAWFDELLKTHMGVCRGSGILKKNKNGWKIEHYNLALTLPNEQMGEYKKLISADI